MKKGVLLLCHLTKLTRTRTWTCAGSCDDLALPSLFSTMEGIKKTRLFSHVLYFKVLQMPRYLGGSETRSFSAKRMLLILGGLGRQTRHKIVCTGVHRHL